VADIVAVVAVSLLARCAGRMAIESLLSNLNEPRNNIVRSVSVSLASGASSWPSGYHGPSAELDEPLTYNRACNLNCACDIRSVVGIV